VTRSKRTIAFVASASVILVLACDRKNVQILTDTAAAGSAGGGTAEQELLAAAPGSIQKALRADSVLRAFELEAEKEGDHVVLKGRVRTEQQKALAAQIAAGQAAGLRVENQIEVEK